MILLICIVIGVLVTKRVNQSTAGWMDDVLDYHRVDLKKSETAEEILERLGCKLEKEKGRV